MTQNLIKKELNDYLRELSAINKTLLFDCMRITTGNVSHNLSVLRGALENEKFIIDLCFKLLRKLK